MQHTENYNLSIIETSDPFSPDALNDNARALETQLARVDAALLAEQSARLSAAATETARVNAALAAKAPQTGLDRVETNLAAEQSARKSEIARLDAAIGTGGTTARMVYGSYEGTGTSGLQNPTKLDFAKTLGCAPKLLVLYGPSLRYSLIAVNGITAVLSFAYGTSSYTCILNWTSTGVSWHSDNPSGQMNEPGKTYYYVAFA